MYNKEVQCGHERNCRRKMMALFLAGSLAAGTVFTGCGKQADDPNSGADSGYQADNGQAGKTTESDMNIAGGDSGTLQARYQIPESCKQDIAVGDTGLKQITIDDDTVTIPDTGDMYIAHFKKKTVGNAERRQVAEAVFDTDQKIYAVPDGKRSRAEVQADIDWCKDLQKQSGDAEGYYSSMIAGYEAELKDALDEYPEAGDYSASTYKGMAGGNACTLYAADTSKDNLGWSYSIDDLLAYKPKDGAEGVYTLGLDDYETYRDEETNITEDDVNSCTITQDKAERLANDFLSKVGVTDMMLKKTAPLCWVYYSSESKSGDMAVDIDGYIFTYGRAINSQPVSVVNAGLADNLSWDPETQQQTDLMATIPAEECIISIDANGVVPANWVDFLEEAGQQEPAKLLSFDEILAKANETVPAYYKKYPTRYNKIEFNDLTLSYYLKQGTDEASFDYVPAWIFSQYTETTGYTDTVNQEQLVVIDATDGSVIDLLELSKAAGSFYDGEEDTDTSDSAEK